MGAVQGAQAYKLHYRTPDHRGQLAEGTGLLYLPAGAAPAGGWPVVSWAHGTQGIADRCAPSVSGPYQPERDGRFLDQFLAQGYAVVAADYQGLGSPGDHAYLHVRTAARNAIDLVKPAASIWAPQRCRRAGSRSAIRRVVPPRSLPGIWRPPMLARRCTTAAASPPARPPPSS